MADLFQILDGKRRQYFDRTRFSNFTEQEEAKAASKTVYVGNLSFYTREEQIYSLMSKAGAVNRVIMGLHRVNRTPCGFCFVIFETREAMLDAANYLTGSIVDGKVIKVEVDPGFVEGRQFGRAKGGGQVRDEMRQNYDAARGGYGEQVESPQMLQPLKSTDRKHGFDFQRGTYARAESYRYEHGVNPDNYPGGGKRHLRAHGNNRRRRSLEDNASNGMQVDEEVKDRFTRDRGDSEDE